MAFIVVSLRQMQLEIRFLIEVDAKNNNKLEWSAHRQHHSLHSLLPTVFGYFEHNLKGAHVASLILSRAGFTFEEMLQRQQHLCPTMLSLTIVVECVIAVVRQLIPK